MAKVDYIGAPTQEPDTQAPQDYQHEEATPAAFGAPLAQGLEQAGSGLMDLAQFYGRVAANQATNNFIDQKTKILFGDPSKPAVDADGKPVMGPDGKSTVGQGGYFALRGQDAMDARPQIEQQLDDLVEEQRDSLRTPAARLQFDVDTRRLRAQETERVASFADQQQKVWMDSVNDQAIATGRNQIGTHLGDQAALAEDRENLRHAYVGKFQLTLGQHSVAAQSQGTLAGDQAFYSTHAVALMNNGHPIDGLQIWRDHQDVLGSMPGDIRSGTPNNTALGRDLVERSKEYLTGYFSDPSRVPAFGGTSVGATPTGSATTIEAAIWGQESNANPNAPTSRKGAVGFGQVIPDTFAKWARPGENIDNPADNQAVSKRMIDHYSEQYGGDPARVAVAYFSGPENVAPASSPTPWIHDRSDGATTTSQYVAQVERRMGAPGTSVEPGRGITPPEDSYLGSVREAAKQVFGEGDPGSTEEVVQRVKANIHRDSETNVAAFEQQARDATAYAGSGGDLSKLTLTPAQIRAAIPGERGEEQAQALEHAIDYNGAVKKIATATPDEVTSVLAGHKPTGPQGFEMNDKEFSALQQAAQDRLDALGFGTKPGDPAAYVTANFPDVGAAFKTALSGQPASFAAYVTRLQGAYRTLGVPDDKQTILPAAVSSGIISNLLTAAPAQASASLSGLHAETGANWPRLYRDLVRAGLPAGLQAALVVGGGPNPADAQVIISAMQRDVEAKRSGKDTMDVEADGMKAASGKSVKDIVNTTMSSDPGLASLRATFGAGGRAGADQFTGVAAAVRQTALYLVITGAQPDPALAAKRAAAMVTGVYDFVPQGAHPPARLPKGAAPDFRAATTGILSGLGAAELQPYRTESDEHGHPLPITEARGSSDALAGARHAYWITVPGGDGSGAVQAMDPASGYPVTMRNGLPLRIMFSRLPALAARYRATAPKLNVSLLGP